MTPERIAAVVLLWARLYTRRLPAADAERRLGELAADLHDHVAHERDHGTGERRIAAGVATRMVRGMAADVSWRRERTRHDRLQETHMSRRSVLRIAVVTAAVLLVPAVLMLAGDGGTDWGVFDFVFAAVIIASAGTLIELVRHGRGTLVYAAAGIAGALGVAAMVAGELDDAPGLVGFGLLLILGMAVLTVRNLQRG